MDSTIIGILGAMAAGVMGLLTWVVKRVMTDQARSTLELAGSVRDLATSLRTQNSTSIRDRRRLWKATRANLVELRKLADSLYLKRACPFDEQAVAILKAAATRPMPGKDHGEV